MIDTSPFNRRFGLEIECVSKLGHSHIAQALVDRNFLVDLSATGHYLCPDRCYSGWQVKTDASIIPHGNYVYGVELASPPLTLHNTMKLRSLLKYVKQFVTLNLTCGLHVHIEAPEIFSSLASMEPASLMIDMIRDKWIELEDILFSYVPLSRRYNQYCQFRANLFAHYSSLNLHHDKTKTLEFRMHQGTLNPRKILAFVHLCMAIVNFLANTNSFEKIEPALSVPVPPKQIRLGTENFYIQRVDKKWILENHKSTLEYPDLVSAYKELKDKLRLGRDYLRAFKYPNHGNAMSVLCGKLGVVPTQTGYLEARYDAMINKFGPFMVDFAQVGKVGCQPDEVELDDSDFDPVWPEPLTRRGI